MKRRKLVLVIRDPKNPKLDYGLPPERAEFLLQQGVLLWDFLRKAFITRDPWAQPR